MILFSNLLQILVYGIKV